MQDSKAPPKISRLASSRRGGRVATPGGVPDVSRRLAALERQVEEALGPAAQAAASLPALETIIDGVVATAERVWRAVSGEPEATAELIETPLDLLYRWWWRVEVIGRERLPARGPLLVVANRAGTLLPYEAFMLARALRSDRPEMRSARPLVDDWLLRLPLVGGAIGALGAEPAGPAVARRVLQAGEVAITFPEGLDAVAKPLAQRYRLAAFSRATLLRAAVDAGAPIVPVAVIGAEEVQPVVWRVERLGRLLGLPAVPVTPAIVPLPTKWTIHIGDPLDPPARGSDARALRTLRGRVRERLQGLVSDGVRRRPGLFA